MSENLTNNAYSFLRRKLIAGELAPGYRVSTRAVARELGVSHTPVGVAVRQLVSEGFLEHHPGLGVTVPIPSRREIEELYEFRCAIETAAVEKIAAQGLSVFQGQRLTGELDAQAAWIGAVEAAQAEILEIAELDAWRSLDARFHLTLLEVAGNRQMLEAFEGVRVKTHIICHRFHEKPLADLSRTIGDHRAVIECVSRGDGELARRLLNEHIQKGCELALDFYDQQYMRHGKQVHFANDLWFRTEPLRVRETHDGSTEEDLEGIRIGLRD